MRHVREILRLKHAGLATREISRRMNVAPSTVRVTLTRFHAAGLTWPLAADMSNRQLEAALYAKAGTKQGHRRRVVPDWTQVRLELQRKHVTLEIVWDEYIGRNPDGYRYSRFCDLYHTWLGTLSLTMRQTHLAGDKLFVDYAGDTVPVVIDRLTGEIRKAQIFVAVLGASSFIYAEATWTQALGDWIGAHTRAFAAIGGCPRLLVPDNTKVAVIKACLYDPQVNRTYAEMAAHYDTTIFPARPRKPRDKAKVEVSVLILERWLLGRLRNRRFHSLTELNDAIQAFLVNLNDNRVIRRLGQTRRQLLEEVDRPALKPLPAEPYIYAEWRSRRVGLDYHVDVDGRYYSVPYRYARRQVDTRVTDRTVEIFLDGELIAAHLRLASHGKHTTLPAHMPSSHRRYADWNIERIQREASAIGPAAALLCELILEQRPHPEQGFRACRGILGLVKAFGSDRLEAAATRALDIGARTYGSVKSILDNNLDRQAAPPRASDGKAILHPNIRGARYYN
ncbi:MAG TPA: IS21 family transposase [Dongiaceae bacterium]|nr:IS21 family transposase [Dongiaceae bacterium]